MSDEAIALNALAVRRLVFVDDVTFPTNVPLIFVELSPRLVSILPVEYHALQLLRESFTVTNVLARYERYVEKLKRHGQEDAIEVAEEMLRIATIQATRL
ncbi:hypothetical protein [Spirosoma agri]|uniref:Uncharacterized protein n=1 Tax=Spirosoma agri TaxID=1987381 RepID=A0A6M0IQF4_9BACT|nr:hypothetical protein [Spirosoma agri]NEU70560.1 hypothetical protein [Spirosoma agri]